MPTIKTQQDMAAWDAGTYEYMVRQARVQARLDSLLDEAHRAAGDKKRRGYWILSHDHVLKELAGAFGSSANTLLAEIAEHETAINGYRTAIEAREAVWEAAGCWPRYFPCLNADGHIHRSMYGCHTVYLSTQMGWATEMSGLTADEAIHGVEGQLKGLGETLCNVCFPDAPAEWCRTRSEVTRAEREAAKAAKDAARNAALAVKNLDRPFRTYDGDRITTVAAAKGVVRRPAETAVELEWNKSEGSRNRWSDLEHYAEFIARMEDRLAKEQADAAQVLLILIGREVILPGSGWTMEEADKSVAATAQRTRKAYFG